MTVTELKLSSVNREDAYRLLREFVSESYTADFDDISDEGEAWIEECSPDTWRWNADRLLVRLAEIMEKK